MQSFSRGHLAARLAQTPEDLTAARTLRHLCFHGRPGQDADDFDAPCQHVLIEDARDGALVGCFRLMPLASGGDIGRSYSAQFYDLSALQGFALPMAELGRFCIHPGHADPDILRIAWGALTRIVDARGVGMLFGCSSFKGTRTAPYRDAFAKLRADHLAPPRWGPGVKAPRVFRFARRIGGAGPDPRRAALSMPPLLRTYLAMGGWVSDHAVVDRALNTLHVFTALEIAAIPPARARALRLIAG
ncbi:MAG: GNAT family N-acyltransferase [Gemmobacter sp.]|nr:GNAT family N-acyltransferase [Gemmobacter sp.]